MSDRVVHIGSAERWSVAREVRAVTDTAIAPEQVNKESLRGQRVMCWHPKYWRAIPEEYKRECRAVVFFHHYVFDYFEDPTVAAALCMNRRMAKLLVRSQPHKPVRIVHVGGAEDAVPYARRNRATSKILLLMVGNAAAPTCDEERRVVLRHTSRKGVELILPIAERLDASRYGWVFVGPNWDNYANTLEGRGWTVIHPGMMNWPAHFAAMGEGDVYLMLSRVEGGPLPLLETMGLGIWPVATPAGFAPELLAGGGIGRLAPAFDGGNGDAVADAVAEHLLSLSKSDLSQARERVRASVAPRTWPCFRTEVEAFLNDVF